MPPLRPRRILIVDDSAVIRSLLRSVVSADPSLEVAGTAVDGRSALKSIEDLHPDLILLDVEMPVMDGLATLREMRARAHKMPVVMCSSLTQRGARVTIEALAAGAADYVTKPAGQAGREAAIAALAQELIPKIHALIRPDVPDAPSPLFSRFGAPSGSPGAIRRQANALANPPAVLAIGVSTGGPAALDVLLPALPASFPLPVLIVQHMPELFTALLAERLNDRSRLRVREAAEGDSLLPGSVFIARGNWHLEALAPARTGQPATLHLYQGRLENHCRPSVDPMFRSIAAVYGASTLAVVLTGMGSDGLGGSRKIREKGGCVLVQDEASSTVWGMPGAVAQAGLANDVLPLHAIAPEILRITSRKPYRFGELARLGA